MTFRNLSEHIPSLEDLEAGRTKGSCRYYMNELDEYMGDPTLLYVGGILTLYNKDNLEMYANITRKIYLDKKENVVKFYFDVFDWTDLEDEYEEEGDES